MSKADRLANLGILIVALSALAVSVWQMRAMEKHNRLSVTPILDFTVIEDDSTKTVMLMNGGIGPAILAKTTYFQNETQYFSLSDAIHAALKDGRTKGVMNYGPNTVFVPNREMFLTRIPTTKQLNIRVEYEYTSIYGEVYFLTIEI